MIGGNVNAVIQVKTSVGKNEIGEDIVSWDDKAELFGFLDLSSGDSKHTVYSAKIQESTHVFICDYSDLSGITSENARFKCNNCEYEILLIDDPMELHRHLEIYLKFAGGQ